MESTELIISLSTLSFKSFVQLKMVRGSCSWGQATNRKLGCCGNRSETVSAHRTFSLTRCPDEISVQLMFQHMFSNFGQQYNWESCYDFLSELGLSHGFIAVIVIGSIIGTIVLCCWVGSVIECIQHIYKYWCSCVRDHQTSSLHHTYGRSPSSRPAAVTTVIANQNADPSTVIVARTLPPSYSSVFCNDGPVIEMSTINEPKNTPRRQMVNAAVQVNTINYDASKSIRWLWAFSEDWITLYSHKKNSISQ